MRSIDDLVAEIRERHFAYPTASPADLERARRLGLPGDALRFYELSDGACLHSASTGGLRQAGGRWWSWVLHPSRELVPISEIGFIDEDCPLFQRARRWIAVVDVQDGNYLALSVAVPGPCAAWRTPATGSATSSSAATVAASYLTRGPRSRECDSRGSGSTVQAAADVTSGGAGGRGRTPVRSPGLQKRVNRSGTGTGIPGPA